ncbi:MAG: phosphate ABC transporter substrate-binding protein PstS [Cyanobacteria bacterium K_Offshore_surface_m2_239]|nr:phosphate ABC transporter substrate-binding protein PstS [Cyanobacteria bacterium K_Offshore_surface_m2_239]
MAFQPKVLSFGLVTSLIAGPAVIAQQTISGAGATFPAPFYQAAFSSLASQGVKVNYQSVGSGAGVRQFVAATVDFGATDEPIKPAEMAKVSRGVVQIPIVGGTIAIAYNKSDCSDLKLTQNQVAEIFLGEITTWDQLKCGKGPLKVVHRSDGSGTTFAFTNSLSSFSPKWKSKVGEGKSVNWPVGVGGKGNEGVSGILTNTPGSIGYVNQAFVKRPLRAAAIQNKAGKFVKPGLKGGAAALNNISLDSDLAGENPNPAGAESYPISTLTWILAYRNGNGQKADDVRKAINYLLGPAQAKADDLGYVPLQGAILNKARRAVARIGN